jgi:hypothetical protein
MIPCFYDDFKLGEALEEKGAVLFTIAKVVVALCGQVRLRLTVDHHPSDGVDSEISRVRGIHPEHRGFSIDFTQRLCNFLLPIREEFPKAYRGAFGGDATGPLADERDMSGLKEIRLADFALVVGAALGYGNLEPGFGFMDLVESPLRDVGNMVSHLLAVDETGMKTSVADRFLMDLRPHLAPLQDDMVG